MTRPVYPHFSPFLFFRLFLSFLFFFCFGKFHANERKKERERENVHVINNNNNSSIQYSSHRFFFIFGVSNLSSRYQEVDYTSTSTVSLCIFVCCCCRRRRHRVCLCACSVLSYAHVTKGTAYMTRFTNFKRKNTVSSLGDEAEAEVEVGEGSFSDTEKRIDTVTRRLADLKFKYDLLSNELFHLREFVSLLEFDPALKNDMESFQKFLTKRGLNFDEGDALSFDDSGSSDKVGRLTRRSFRTSTILRDVKRSVGRKRGGEDGYDVDDSVAAVRLQRKMKEVELFVQQKFEQLKEGVVPLSQLCMDEAELSSHSGSGVKENTGTLIPKDGHDKLVTLNKPIVDIKSDNGIKQEPAGKRRRLTRDSNDDNKQLKGSKRILESNVVKLETENDNFTSEALDISKDLPGYGNRSDLMKLREIENEDGDDYYFTTSTDDEDDADSLETNRSRTKRRKYEKLKKPHVTVKLSKLQQTVTNPYHVFQPKYETLEQYLNSFKLLAEEDMTLTEYGRFIKEQRELASKVRDGIRKGVLMYDPMANSLQAVSQKDVQLSLVKKPDPVSHVFKEDNKRTHHDYLVSHAVVVSRMFQSEQRARIARARKVSQMIEQHFKHAAGSLERKQREEERQRRLIIRGITQAVRKRWRLAERAYQVLKRDEEERLKQIQGKKKLTKILEQSSQLLGAQLNSRISESLTSPFDGNADSSAVDEDRDMTFSSSDTFDSSSSSEFDTAAVSARTGDETPSDEYLSVEELRKKYSHLDDIDLDSNSINSPRDKGHSDGSNEMVHGDEEVEESRVSETDRSLNGLTPNSDTFVSEEEEEDGDETEETEVKGSNSLGLSALITQDFVSKGTQDDTASSDEQFIPGDEFDEEEEDDDISMTEESELGSNSDFDSDDFSGDASSVSSPKKLSKDEVDITSPGKNIESFRDTQTSNKDKATAESVNGLDSQIDNQEPKGHLNVIDVPVPSLLRGTLRTYQKQGLNWLASLYNNNTNGILADEMGLGKTIQTISLLAYLACEKQNWGPHLIIVPTSVLLNWEMEFKRFCPGLKVLTYYGTPQQRKEKRKGWNKEDAFHVCIVSYQLVVQDQHSFKRKKWEYMVLDEAHNIKNFRSTRWQALLNFNTKRRLLLTGTPLQNNLAELWSLLYFLMPQTVVNGKKVSGFADLDVFQQWFGHHVEKIVETNNNTQQDEETRRTVAKLHSILRPYLLRRLKADVEKQMPAKYEHIVYCKLSRRQRFLYDDFMSRAQTKEILASGNFLSILSCLMQLRKVCNHPDLFEVRPILTSFEAGSSVIHGYSGTNKFVRNSLLRDNCFENVDLHTLNLIFSDNDRNMTSYDATELSRLKCIQQFLDEVDALRTQLRTDTERGSLGTNQETKDLFLFQDPQKFFEYLGKEKIRKRIDDIEFHRYVNTLRCDKKPVYGKNLLKLVTLNEPKECESLEPLITPLQTRFLTEKTTIDKFAVLTPRAVTLDVRPLTLGLNTESDLCEYARNKFRNDLSSIPNPFSQLQTKLSIAFPDKFLLQYDCGKLQKLATLLQELKDNSHRALIFTQMTKVLDILELFLSYHGYIYLRLDGATKVEDRQLLTERFNSDERITVFILSSRSGGLGINLTGADTVIFYDSDWNPAMDKQCQDRCHRIGQTRDVHIYRFVSEHTIESNILMKANQKRRLDNVVIQEGEFTTDYFSKLSVKDLFGSDTLGDGSNDLSLPNKPLLVENPEVANDPKNLEKLLAQAEDKDDVRAANLALQEVEVDDEDFNEEENQDGTKEQNDFIDEYEGTGHVEEYMIRMVADGYCR